MNTNLKFARFDRRSRFSFFILFYRYKLRLLFQLCCNFFDEEKKNESSHAAILQLSFLCVRCGARMRRGGQDLQIMLVSLHTHPQQY